MSTPGAREAVVVEDDEDIGRLLKFILEREGYRVTLYADGRKASERFQAQEVPALVLLDVMLPYVNGHQLLEMIRGSTTWKPVPVLMLTAKSGETDVVRALDGGASDYLTKPFVPAELKARVRRLVPKP